MENNNRDKIFNNTFGEQDLSGEITFELSPRYDTDLELDERLHYETLFETVNDLIKGSEYEDLNKMTKDGIIKKLNKMQINQVFFYIIENIKNDYNKVDLFSVLSDYFDISPNKFYNSLSNKFKDELINELDDKYGILKKKKINKLF